MKATKRGLRIPYNWDFSLLAELGKLNQNSKVLYPVVEVYAADKYSFVGSGRTAATVYERKKPVEAFIEKAHRCGIRFDYLWNGITLGGPEWNPELQRNPHQEAKALGQRFCQFCLPVAKSAILLRG